MFDRLKMWLVVAAGTVVLGSLVIGRLASGGSSSILSRRQMERVVPGMARTEVVALLGGAPGDYRTDRERFTVSHHSLDALGGEQWIGDEAKVEVWFDNDERVTRVRVRDAIDRHPPLNRQLLEWLQEACDDFANYCEKESR
jgi:hypothetical protein